MKSRCSFIAVTILILTLTLVCVGCTDGEVAAKDEQSQFYTSTITSIASAVQITVEAPALLNESEITTEKAEEVIGNSVEKRTPTKTEPAQTSSQAENHLTPESTSPVSTTPPSDYSPPDFFEGEVNEIIDYGVYCGHCGSQWDMEHNTCPSCFPYDG